MFPGRIIDQLEESVKDPINFFKCNQKWPMCSFNFAKPHMIPDQFVFKAENHNFQDFVEDYFSVERIEREKKNKRNKHQRGIVGTATSNILIERNYHYCKINQFTNQLASLYASKSKQEKLFMCKYYDIKKKMTLLETHKKMLKFCAYVKAQELPKGEKLKNRRKSRGDVLKL